MTTKLSSAACDRLLRDILNPITLGETVSVEGRGRYTVVGFECDGDVVKLDDGNELFSVYLWRVARIGQTASATKGTG